LTFDRTAKHLPNSARAARELDRRILIWPLNPNFSCIEITNGKFESLQAVLLLQINNRPQNEHFLVSFSSRGHMQWAVQTDVLKVVIHRHFARSNRGITVLLLPPYGHSATSNDH
jgi:hypothetical protein